jgi:putative sterol carrier protein
LITRIPFQREGVRVAGFEVFTAAWADAWHAALNASEAYRRAAATWEGAVALVMHPDGTGGIGERRAVWLDLWHGSCRAARVATAEDLASAPFVIEANARTWRELLDARTSPIMALMTGRLSLTRGSVAALLPYASAANELVAAAALVQTTFPDAA